MTQDQQTALLRQPGRPDARQPGVHAYLKENNVPHTWHVDGNAHDPSHWKNTVYHFLQQVLR